MKPFSEMGDAELAAALRGIRPEPTPAFAAELDQRVAAGFPRRAPQHSPNPFARFLAWLRRGSRWRLLIPAGGIALAAIAVATVVVSSQGSSGTSSFARNQPEVTQVGGASGAAKEAESESKSRAATPPLAPPDLVAPSAGGAAAGTAHRSVERAAEIVIGTKPGEVGEASSQVFEAVHAYDGIVLSSSTQNGSGANAEANFELLIPSSRVGDAMAAFSRIGEVVNRQETTNDITAPTVGAGERLQDSEARVEGLLAQLSETTTESEREVVEAELGAERRHAAHVKAKLANLKRRANLSRVSVRIVSGKGALTPGAPSDGDWGVGDALGDAGHLLSVAAGVTIVGLAVLAPLLLLALLAWLAGRTWARRARERALT
jgi:Domain of unknown function (DUF4349)